MLTVVGYSNNLPSSALVMLRLSEPLRTCGIQYLTGHIPGEFCRPDLVSRSDLVVIQRDFPAQRSVGDVLARAHAEGRRVIFDLDDLLLDLPYDHPNLATYGQPAVLFPVMQALVEADAVTVSTPALADYCSEFNRNVWVLPNYLNDSLWSLTPKTNHVSPNTPLVVGFMGTDSHIPDLLLLRDILGKIAQRYSGRIHFHFWGCPPPAELRECIGADQLTWTPFSLASYPEFIARFSQITWDIFLAPLRDNLFNRCKSAIKFLEYSAINVPGVYARLPPYTTVVTHGENGFLAQTSEEWEHYLSLLIESPELRYEMGRKANATVERDWLLSRHAHEWAEVYQHVASPAFQSDRASTAVRVARQATRIGCDPHLQGVIVAELNRQIAYLEALNQGYRNGRLMRLMLRMQGYLNRARQRHAGTS